CSWLFFFQAEDGIRYWNPHGARAEGADVLGMVVRTGLRPVAAGLVIGIAVSLVLGRIIGTQLVGVTAYDPLTLAATTLLLTITAAIACWIPARRAGRADPMVALRYE